MKTNYFKRIISMILLVLLSFSFAACAPTKTEDEKKEESNDVVIADFEKWAPDFQLIRLMDGFGAVNKNSDLAYVKNGKFSAKLQPLGSYSHNKPPFLYFPLQSSLFGFDYCDFSRVEKITASVFNAEDTDINILMGLVIEIENIDNVTREQGNAYNLKPGWNQIEYIIDLNVLSISFDIKNFKGIYFLFENMQSRDIEDAPVLYLDDIILKRAASAKPIENLITLDENEIVNFEKLYQAHIFSVESRKFSCVPKIEVISASDYGITATSGTRMLRLVTRPGDTAAETWPRIVLAESIMQASKLKGIPSKDYSDIYFCFDVYNNSDKAMTFYAEFYSKGERNWQPFEVVTVRNQWKTIRIRLSSLNSANVNNPGILGMAWAEYEPTFAGELEFFFDSFRLEKI